MESSTLGGCHKLPPVEDPPELLETLLERLRAAVGELSTELDRDDYVAGVADVVLRARGRWS